VELFESGLVLPALEARPLHESTSHRKPLAIFITELTPITGT